MTPELHGFGLVGIGAFAARVKSAFAEEALPAGNRKRNYHPIADLEGLVLCTDLDDFTHRLMAQDIAFLHRRNDAIEDVQIGTTNGAGRDLDYGVASILDLWVWHALASDVVLAVPSQGLHARSVS